MRPSLLHQGLAGISDHTALSTLTHMRAHISTVHALISAVHALISGMHMLIRTVHTHVSTVHVHICTMHAHICAVHVPAITERTAASRKVKAKGAIFHCVILFIKS